MATSTIPITGLVYKDFVSNSVSIPANGKTDVTFPNTAISGFSKLFYRMTTGSTVAIRNNIVLYGNILDSGSGVKAFDINGEAATGTITIRVFYIPTNRIRKVS